MCRFWALQLPHSAEQTFLLLQEGQPPTLPPPKPASFSWGHSADSCRKDSACWKRVPNFPLARDCSPTWVRTISSRHGNNGSCNRCLPPAWDAERSLLLTGCPQNLQQSAWDELAVELVNRDAFWEGSARAITTLPMAEISPSPS